MLSFQHTAHLFVWACQAKARMADSSQSLVGLKMAAISSLLIWNDTVRLVTRLAVVTNEMMPSIGSNSVIPFYLEYCYNGSHNKV